MLSRMVSLLLLSPVAASSMDSMELDAPPPPPPAVHSRTVTFCLSEIRASFAALDANGDGVLSQAELGIAPPVRPTISLTPGTASGGLNATSSGVLTLLHLGRLSAIGSTTANASTPSYHSFKTKCFFKRPKQWFIP